MFFLRYIEYFGEGGKEAMTFVFLFSLQIILLTDNKLKLCMYPKYKKVLMRIDTKKHKLIVDWLEKSEY